MTQSLPTSDESSRTSGSPTEFERARSDDWQGMGLDRGDALCAFMEELLADEMQAVRCALDALPDSPRRRELSVRLETYERAFEAGRFLEAGASATGAPSASSSPSCKRRQKSAARRYCGIGKRPRPARVDPKPSTLGYVLGLMRWVQQTTGEVGP